TQGDGHGVGQEDDTTKHLRARLIGELYDLCWHDSSPLLRFSGLDDPEDVFLTQDEVLLAIDLDLGSRILAEQDTVARLDVEGDDLAFLVELSPADCDDLALLGLLLCGVRDDDAAGALLLLVLDPLDDQAVCQRTDTGCHQ